MFSFLSSFHVHSICSNSYRNLSPVTQMPLARFQKKVCLMFMIHNTYLSSCFLNHIYWAFYPLCSSFSSSPGAARIHVRSTVDQAASPPLQLWVDSKWGNGCCCVPWDLTAVLWEIHLKQRRSLIWSTAVTTSESTRSSQKLCDAAEVYVQLTAISTLPVHYI